MRCRDYRCRGGEITLVASLIRNGDKSLMPVSKNDACDFLTSLQRYDLAMLLRECDVSLGEKEGWFGDMETIAEVVAPPAIHEALESLSPQDRKRIAQAIASGDPETDAPADITTRVKTGTADNVVEIK